MIKKVLKLFFLILIHFHMNAQETLDIDSKDYKRGRYILENSKRQLSEAGGVKNYADYWNFALASALMGKSKELVLSYLKESKKSDNVAFNDICKRLIGLSKNDIKNTRFYKVLNQDFVDLFNESNSDLKQEKNEQEEENFVFENNEVASIIRVMLSRDQKYRGDYDFISDKNKQRLQYKLDEYNCKELEFLFNKYGYAGKSLLGDNVYKNYMCLIVEHGQKLEDQKRWLNVILVALSKGELDKNPVRMLLDRIHWKETGKQYFGSHMGVPFEDEKEINKIRRLYNL